MEGIDQSIDEFVECEDALDVNDSIGLDEGPWVKIEQPYGNDVIVQDTIMGS